MKFSENWLREWVNPDIATDKLVHQLTMAGLEVDGTEAAANSFSGVVVAEVQSVEKHPDADKLSVCQVSDGKETFQVVCGAPNVAAGLKVPFAKVGAILAEDFSIKKAKLRGVESNGMLCAAEELGLAEKSDGIMVLADDAPIGEDFRDYLQLDDTLIEVDLTPNRGDCLSIAGLAREVSVLNNSALNGPDFTSVKASIDETFPVELHSPEDCPRYLGRVIRNVNINASTPLWMQEKLRRSGIRSIEPAVDVTNYVMLELGQPMHAFDLDVLQGGIQVRRAARNEKLVLLDGREVELSADTLVIADHEKALAMAGVMGGEHSGVTSQTQNLFLESAFFNPLAIAGKARQYGMHTDASHRFERGVDYALAEKAIERATQLMLEILGGEAGPVIKAEENLPEAPEVSLRAERVSKILGVEVAVGDIETMLTGLGLELLEKGADSWRFRIPSWRFDIALEADLIEELARIYGYDNIPLAPISGAGALKPATETTVSLRKIRSRLNSLGYQEVINYSFVEPELEKRLAEGAGAAIALANPISSDMAVMRRNLWTGLLQTLKHNQNRQQNRVQVFESGMVFSNENGETRQQVMLGGLLWGSENPEQWGASTRNSDFYDMKGDVESILGLGNARGEFSFAVAEHPALQPGQSARILRMQQPVGWIGALKPQIQHDLDIPGKVFLFELALAGINASVTPRVTALSRYPSVRRDLAIMVDESLVFSELEGVLQEQGGEFLENIVLFDVYQGEKLEKGKKSLAIGLTFQHPSRTLNDDEINGIINSCIKALEAQFNAELR
ncbi:MAG: phenylalanine--tRNA ligase subunit beta [Gammaproteobacteria bacterium]|nr:phenylalanine--tRNA ligase subunit beta [Gammaproteobacteria bacterium]